MQLDARNRLQVGAAVTDPVQRPTADLRREDARFVTGRGRYIADLAGEQTLHAAFVRSQEAHARVTSVDVSDAIATRDVLGVWTAAELDLADQPFTWPGVEFAPMPRPPLARETVRYVSEPIAIVVAGSARAAADAADLVWVDYEPLPPVSSPLEALKDEVLLHPAAGTNVVEEAVIGCDVDARSYDVCIDIAVVNQRLGPTSIEPLGILARPMAASGVETWISGQGAHRVQEPLQELLGIPVEVHIPDVGGAFGMKGPFYPEYAAVAAAAMRLDREVMWIQTRREHLQGGTQGRGQHTTVQLAGDADGRIRWGHVTMIGDVGAYPVGANVTTFSRRVSSGLYDIQNFRVETKTVATNRAPTGPYRGAGRPEAAYAIERAIDAFAREAGLDPIEVRFKNFVDHWPYQTVPGALFDSGDYAGALRMALGLIDLPAIRRDQAERFREGRDPVGFGLGTFVERAGGPVKGGEYGRIEVADDGTAVAYTGSVSGGQGHETVWARVAADALGMDCHNVTVAQGDTTLMPRSAGTSASRSAQLGASALYNAGSAIRRRATELAAELFEAARVDILVEGGVFTVAGSPGARMTYAELAAEARSRGEPLTEDEWFAPGAQTFPYGAHAAVVEVKLETGEVRLRELIAVDDCGNILNPMIVEGQIHGSLMQGIGQALYEGIVYADDGQLRTSTLMDYQVPRAGDQPRFVLDRLVTPAPSNPLGVKGTGEAGCIGAPPAIVNAVLDALHPYGVTHLDMPLQPATVWGAIQQATTGS